MATEERELLACCPLVTGREGFIEHNMPRIKASETETPAGRR